MLPLFKSLSDPCRLRLVALLRAGELTVQELTRITGLGQSRISRHLKILCEAGVLTVKRQGTWSYYRVGREHPLFAAMLPLLERELVQLPDYGEDCAALAQVLEERRRRSQEFFDRHARQWDELARTLLPVPDYGDRLLALIPIGVRVVEIGLGTGGLLPALASAAKSVIGVDHSPAMLEEARRRLIERGLTGIDLRLGEMTHLPLPDASVDCAVLNMVLHHAADPPVVVGEIRRVLAPGGRMVLADLARHERDVAREQLADQWLGFDEAELESWFAVAGFTDFSCEKIQGTSGQEVVLLVSSKK